MLPSDTMSVSFFSAKTVNEKYDLGKIATRVLNSYWYVLGEEVKYFEEEFASYNGVRHCISVANGSDAIEIALRSVGVKPQDKVIAVANAGFYSSTAIRAIGAEPVYVDIDHATMTMSPSALKEAVSIKPSAIIVTHLYGQLADIETLASIAKEAGIPLIEDCAQSHGAMLKTKKAGSFSDIACFSFYPTKNLGALGDGGAIVTSDDSLAATVRQLRQYGWSKKYNVSLAGGKNSRLDEIQAAFLREKLPSLDQDNSARRAIAKRYNIGFADLNIITPSCIDERYVAHLYVLRISDRDAFAEHLKSHSVSYDVHYPIADHHQLAYQCDTPFDLSETEQACRHVISLPCYPGLTDQEIDHVIATVRRFFK